MRGLFVTGTGTGVGKTVLSAALLAAIAAAGERVSAHKPVVTGVDDPPGEWPPDHELLARVAGMTPEEVAPLRYGPAVSPHLAAELAGERVDPERIAAAAQDALRSADARGAVLIVEGVGGLLVPLAEGFTVRDLAARLGLPLVDRRVARTRHDQPHAAHPGGRPHRGARGARGRAHALAHAARCYGRIQSRHDRTVRRRRSRGSPPRVEPRSGRTR